MRSIFQHCTKGRPTSLDWDALELQHSRKFLENSFGLFYFEFIADTIYTWVSLLSGPSSLASFSTRSLLFPSLIEDPQKHIGWRKRRISCHQKIHQVSVFWEFGYKFLREIPFVLTNNARETARISLTEFQKPSFSAFVPWPHHQWSTEQVVIDSKGVSRCASNQTTEKTMQFSMRRTSRKKCRAIQPYSSPIRNGNHLESSSDK